MAMPKKKKPSRQAVAQFAAEKGAEHVVDALVGDLQGRLEQISDKFNATKSRKEQADAASEQCDTQLKVLSGAAGEIRDQLKNIDPKGEIQKRLAEAAEAEAAADEEAAAA